MKTPRSSLPPVPSHDVRRKARDPQLKLPIKDAWKLLRRRRNSAASHVRFGSGPANARPWHVHVQQETNSPIIDKEGCEWHSSPRLLSLKEARWLKAQCVVNIQSYYKKNEFSSATEYECGAGAFVGGVTLRGTIAKL